MSSCRTLLPEKELVRDGFSRAVYTYDRHAHHHRVISSRLSGYLPTDFYPGSILETGCGTGILTGLLLERFPRARIQAIDLSPEMVLHCRQKFSMSGISFTAADAEEFRSPLRRSLVISSCAVQWFHRALEYPRMVSTCLETDGLLALAVPVEGSLHEIAESFRIGAGRELEQLHLPAGDRWQEAFKRAGLKEITFSEEEVSHEYGDPIAAMRAVNGIGASLRGRREGISPRCMELVVEYYRRNFSTSGGTVRSTYRICYMIGRLG